MKNTLKIILFVLFTTTLSYGQVLSRKNPKIFGREIKNINPKNGMIRCASSEYEEYLQEIHPKRTSTEEFESWLAPFVEAKRKELQNTTTSPTARGVNTVIIIPVVVHVVHNGQSVGQGKNISDARVMSQITVLNQDYRKAFNTRGYNTNPIGADMEIEFRLAKIKPDGTPTNGINRVQRTNAQWSTESSVETTLKPSTIWDPTKYLNIWTVEFNDTNQNVDLYGTLGYAQFPTNSGLGGMIPSGDESTDGIIIDWRCFGTSDLVGGYYFSDYDKGRTTSHEIGHFLGLRHIWGDNSNCNGNATDSTQDYCPDTPTARQPNFDCDSVYNSCPSAPGNDMTENYMDYTTDICLNTFTNDQKARVIAVMQNSPRRSTLATSTVWQDPLSNSSFDLIQGLHVYPNPASDRLTIAINDNVLIPDSYSIFNSLGQTIISQEINSTQDLNINIAHLSNGVYFIKVSKDNSTKTLKFIKE